MGGVVCVVFVFVPGKNQQGRFLYYSQEKKKEIMIIIIIIIKEEKEIMKKLNSEKYRL